MKYNIVVKDTELTETIKAEEKKGSMLKSIGKIHHDCTGYQGQLYNLHFVTKED